MRANHSTSSKLQSNTAYRGKKVTLTVCPQTEHIVVTNIRIHTYIYPTEPPPPQPRPQTLNPSTPLTLKPSPPHLLPLPFLHPPNSAPNPNPGTASCLPPATHPSSPTPRLQHDHRNPQEKFSYSIRVHASPWWSGSKFSQTGCVGWTSRSPFWGDVRWGMGVGRRGCETYLGGGCRFPLRLSFLLSLV